MQYVGHSQQHAPVKILKAFQISGTQVCTKAHYQGISDSSLSICQSLHRVFHKHLVEGRKNKMSYWPLLHMMQESKQQRACMGMCTFLWVHMEKKGKITEP